MCSLISLKCLCRPNTQDKVSCNHLNTLYLLLKPLLAQLPTQARKIILHQHHDATHIFAFSREVLEICIMLVSPAVWRLGLGTGRTDARDRCRLGSSRAGIVCDAGAGHGDGVSGRGGCRVEVAVWQFVVAVALQRGASRSSCGVVVDRWGIGEMRGY